MTLVSACAEESVTAVEQITAPEGVMLNLDEVVVPLGLAGLARVTVEPGGLDPDANVSWRSVPEDVIRVYRTPEPDEFVFAGENEGPATLTLSIDDGEVWSVQAHVPFPTP